MSRRTISLASNLEKEVRQKQAQFMVQTNRNISFTEAVNVLLASVLAVDGKGQPDLEKYQTLLESTDFDSESVFDQIQEILLKRKWEDGSQ